MKTIFINNEWHNSSGNDKIAVINPSNGQVIEHIDKGTKDDIDMAVQAAKAAFLGPWSDISPAQRSQMLFKLANLLKDNVDELTRLESIDCGKPLGQARADAIAIARYFEFYAGACDKFHGETIPYANDFSVLTWREPHGVTAHIVPWNYPMQIFGRCVAGALAAGNTVVVKPAEDACLSLLKVMDLTKEAGFPDGVINLVTGYGYEVGNDLVSHPGVDYISFTGSPAVGTLVAQAAAANHTAVTLELGGKSPQIIFPDANLDDAINSVVRAFVQNAGQTCSAGSRLLVHKTIYQEVLNTLKEKVSKLKVGPADLDLDCGPLIRENQLQRVQKFYDDAIAQGVSLLAQASIVADASDAGYYFAPAVFVDVDTNSSLAQEEIFGPILSVTMFDTEQQAIEIANGTDFGLVASVWTADGGRQQRMARKLQAGQVFINNYGAAGGIELPFGGVKSSGYGREKGFEALYGFTQLKTIAMKFDNKIQ